MSTQQATSTGVLGAAEILDLTLAQAGEAGRDDLIRRLSDARRLLVDSTVTVHVVGESQQGKSSLMEALITPTGSAAQSGRLSATRDVPGEVAVAVPAGRVAFVEAAAMNGRNAASTAGEGSARAHAVLFVSDASGELTRSEIDYLRTIQDLCPTIIFVLTKIDLNARWRQVLERDKELLHDAGIGVEAVAVSATLRVQGLRSGDDELARMSGVAKLLDQLEQIAADAEQTSLRAVANHVLFALDQLTEMLRFRQSRLVQPGRAAQARAAARLAEERTESLRGRSTRWQKMLHDSFATITSDVDFDLRQRMQAALAETEQAIEKGDPAKNWDEFATRLRERLAHEARANNDLSVTSSRTVSLRVAEHFTVSEMHVIDPPPARIPTDLPTVLIADQALGTSRAGLSAGMNIFFRAYMGFMMFYLLTRLTDRPLPLVIGLAPALLMGGLALVEERKRQLDKRRSQASIAVRSYVTDFSMRITKDSRDLLRQLEQELRDAYSARGEQMQRSITEARNLAQRTLKELEQSPTLLRQIDGDLALLDDLRGRATAIIPAQLLAPGNALY